MISQSTIYAVNRLKAVRLEELRAKVNLWLRHATDRATLRLAPHMAWWERMEKGLSGVTSRAESGADVGDYDQALCKAIPENWWNDDSFWTVFAQRYRSEVESVLERARAVMDGTFVLFQWKSIDAKARLSWSGTWDPDAPGKRWPEQYHSTIEVLHDPLTPRRDIKWCWELNRFQHLLWLGAGWRLTRDEQFAQSAREQVESWLAAVRYPYGVQWNSNLEVALRALAWAHCHVLCRDSPAWGPDFLQLFLPALYVHGVHLERELTVHHPQSNHLLGEATVLVILGHLYPLFAGADRWQKRGSSVVSDVVPQLILPDGVYGEQSTGYLRFVAEFLLELMYFTGNGIHKFPHPNPLPEAEGASGFAALRDGKPVADQHTGVQPPACIAGTVKERLCRALRFVGIIGHDPADVPMIGDSDTGRAIGWQISDYWDFRWLLAAGAVLAESPELAASADQYPAEAYLLLGSHGHDRFVSLRDQARAQMECHRAPGVYGFPCGGYQVSRDDSFHIIFDCGPLGLEPSHAHGHCDALSFNLCYEGLPLFIDPGTYMYNGPQDWRHYFRSSAAHNTVRLDGRDPSVPLGSFRWINPVKVSAGPHCQVGQWRCFRGCVDLGEAQHERIILHLAGQVVIVVDRVLGSGVHDVEWNLHLGSSWQVIELQERVRLLHGENRAVDMFLEGLPGVVPSLLLGSENPIGGWCSRYYGQLVPSPTLRWSHKTRLPTVAVLGVKKSGHTVDENLRIPLCGLAEESVELLRSERFRSFLSGSKRET